MKLGETYLYVVSYPYSGISVCKVGATGYVKGRMDQIFTQCPRRKSLLSDGMCLFACYELKSRFEALRLEASVLKHFKKKLSDSNTRGWIADLPGCVDIVINGLAEKLDLKIEPIHQVYERWECSLTG